MANHEHDSKFYGTCEKCYQDKMVCNTVDPFDDEILDKQTPITICRTCYDLICDEI